MARKLFRGLISCTLVSVLILFPALLPSTQAQDARVSPPGIDEIVRKIIDSYEKVDNFQCTLDKFERLGDEIDHRTYRYFFMKPRLIRMEIIKGKNTGAVAIFNQGKVRARKGGLLGLFSKTCQPDDETVTSLRGGTVLDSDWQNIIDKLRDFHKGGILKLVGPESHSGRQAYLIEAENMEEDGLTKRRLWVGRESYLPLATELYKDDILVSAMVYSDVVVNGDIPQGTFN